MEGQSVLVELASDPTEKSRKNKTGKDLLYAVQASGSTRPWLSQVSFPNMILLICPTPTVKGNTRLLTETPQLAISIFLWRTTTLQLLSHTTDDRAATLSHMILWERPRSDSSYTHRPQWYLFFPALSYCPPSMIVWLSVFKPIWHCLCCIRFLMFCKLISWGALHRITHIMPTIRKVWVIGIAD